MEEEENLSRNWKALVFLPSASPEMPLGLVLHSLTSRVSSLRASGSPSPTRIP